MTFIEEMETKRFIINRMHEGDLHEIYRIRSDEKVLEFIGREPMASEEEALPYLLSVNEMIFNKTGCNWAIRRKDEKKMMGYLGFYKLMPDRNRAEVGYALLPEHHRQGVMYECLQRILDYAFQNVGWHSVCAEIDPYNEGSRKLLEKCGFKKEAHFTEDFYFNGKYSDSAIYSLLEKWR